MRQLQATMRDDLPRLRERLDDGVAAEVFDGKRDLALPWPGNTTERGATT